MLIRRAHPPEQTQDLVWKNVPNWLAQEKSDWHVARIRSFDSWVPEIGQFKTTKKKPLFPTVDVKDFEWHFILSYSQYQEVATRVMVKIVKNHPLLSKC